MHSEFDKLERDENPLAGRQKTSSMAEHTTIDASESWRNILSVVLSRPAPLHEALMSDEVNMNNSFHEVRQPLGSIVTGNAPSEKLESFAYLAEMLTVLKMHIMDFLQRREPTSTMSSSYLLLMYVQIIVRELQEILNVTLLDPSFANELDAVLVNDFLKLWHEAVTMVSELGENVKDSFETVMDSLIATSRQLVVHWTDTEAAFIGAKTIPRILGHGAGCDPDFETTDDKERALVFAGLLLFQLATLVPLPSSISSLGSLLNCIGGVFVSTILTGLFVAKRRIDLSAPVLLLCSLTPVLYYPGLDDTIPWGVLFTPAWFMTALGSTNNRAVSVSCVFYVMSYAGNAILTAQVEDSSVWKTNVYCAITMVFFFIGLFIYFVAFKNIYEAELCKNDAVLYRHIAILALKSAIQEIQEPLRDFVSTFNATLGNEDVNNLNDHDIAQLVTLMGTIHQTIKTHSKVNGRDTKKRALSDASLSKLSRMITLQDAGKPTSATPTVITPGIEQVFPFGEITFPDPFDEEGNSNLRIDNRLIHPYLGIIIMNGDGEILFWNLKMQELTGVTADQAIGNEIISFVIDAEQVTLLRIMEEALVNHIICSDSVLIPFIRGDKVNRAFLEVSVASVAAEGEYLALLATQPSQDSLQHVEFARWLFEQFIASTDTLSNCLHKVQSTDPDVCKLKQLSTACVERIRNVHSLVLRANTDDSGQCYLHIKTMLNKMITDFQKLGSKKDLKISMLPVAPDTPTVIYTQPVKLACAVNYLLSNAVKYSHEGGEVTVSLSVTNEIPGGVGTVNVCIADLGVGIENEKLRTLFDAFARPESSHHGLPTAGVQINEIGGYIDVASILGAGTTFTIKLPNLSRDDAGEESKTRTSPLIEEPFLTATMPVTNIRCLLVESNAAYRTAFCHHFWERGYALVTKNSLDATLDTKEYDLMVISVSAVASEADFLEKLKNSSAEVIIASKLFTGYHRDMIEEAGWFGLNLPLKRKALTDTLLIAEARIAENHQKAQEIDDIRRAFVGNSSCPWERGKMIGAGSFGKVFEATNKLTGGKMACKIIPIPTDDTQLKEILREVTVMAGLSHPNIIHYFYCDRAEDELHIFMEIADGCLSAKIPPKGMDPPTAAVYMKDILRGLQYLHSRHIVHRDIKVANVLIHGNHCKLTDFGTAVPLQVNHAKRRDGEKELLNTTAGTPHYMAPEILNEHGHDWKADIWSLGCLLMEMVTNKPPWSHTGSGSWAAVKYVCNVASDPTLQLDFGPYSYHGAVLQFLQQCLCIDPDKRMDTTHLLELPLLTEMNDDLARKTSICTLANEFKTRESAVRSGSKAPTAKFIRHRISDESEETEVDGVYQKVKHSNTLQSPALEDLRHGPRSKKKSRKPMKVVKASEGLVEASEKVFTNLDDENDDEDLRRGTNFSGWGGSM